MNVQFVATTKARLPELPVADGQVIALSDTSGYYYDMGGVRHAAGSGFEVVQELPEQGSEDKLYVLLSQGRVPTLYIWTTSTGYVPLETTYEEMSYEQYMELTEEEKMDGKLRFVPDRGEFIISEIGVVKQQLASVVQSVTSIADNLTAEDDLQFNFATDGEGHYGFLKADGSFSPFNQGGGSSDLINAGFAYNPVIAVLDVIPVEVEDSEE